LTAAEQFHIGLGIKRCKAGAQWREVVECPATKGSVEDTRMRKSGLPPVVYENTEILILGTLPSDTQDYKPHEKGFVRIWQTPQRKSR
jgi:hypothetical protein